MFSLNRTQFIWTLVGLAVLMVVSRSHHFDSAISLPDASLAVFFLAGLYLQKGWTFPVLLTMAGLIDYLSITFGGVSGWCVTPAYFFLIPVYGVMWFAGLWCATKKLNGFSGTARFALVAFGAASAAFLISNGSFYLFSGQFGEMSITEYTGRTATYYSSYVAATLLYISVIIIAHAGVRSSLAGLASQSDSSQ